ncbi:hypothetical protein [Malonomonas rubra]|uniref:hypothetical protein n=1 Tax=Malonomonas rubra TaxID=57040 RepID=UPI0026F0871A|nr:hypothetical protein [Malonomonas rubra]
MKLKLLKLFAWFLLSVALLTAVDRLLVLVPIEIPGVTQAQTFYIDFRGRLLNLFGFETTAKKSGQSIEQMIEATQQQVPDKSSKPQRYLYVDESGALQFADSLQQVPARYREHAQPLAE